jgi:THO complex subunit 5
MEAELAALRQLAISLATLKRQGHNDQASVQDLALKGQLQLLAVKEAHKRKCLQVEDMKEETARAKQSLEASDLALQNLLYEKQYYEKEIFTCRSFKSKVPEEAVDLMPVEQFWASLSDSPEDAQTRAKAKSSDHELMKQRLVHENNQRRALVRQLEQLKQTKVSLLNTVGAQERVLKELQVREQSLTVLLSQSAKP